MLPETVVIRYIAVRRLADRGVPGERDNALRILRRMEAEHPQIRAAADAYEHRGVEDHEHPRPSSGARTDWARVNPWGEGHATADAPPGFWPKFPGSWEEFVRAAVNGASRVAETVGNVVLGRQLAEHVAVQTRESTKTDIITISIKIPGIVYAHALRLNELQLAAFREVLHQKVEAELEILFSDENEGQR